MDPQVRLYLENPDLLEFEAQVLETRPLPEGAVGIVLDRTAFYPTSGGQPHDTGTLGGEPVIDVHEAPDGAVVHRMRVAPAAARVAGRIDAARRRDHMQQHSGQHLLSATAVALYERETSSFHLGAERCSIDLPGPLLEPAALAELERRSNEIIWEGRPVRARFLAPGEATLLRKPPPEGTGAVRVVEIEGWDVNACCGTHVQATQQIGLVKILGQEKLGDAARIAFVCGARAVAACDQALNRIDALVRLLTCHPDEIADRCTKLVQDNKTLRKETERLASELAVARAASLLAAAPRPGGVPLVAEEIQGGEPALRELAAALVGAGAVALLGARSTRAALLFACPEGLGLDLRPALQAACVPIEGRGGGPPSRVQGAGARLDGLAAALEAARADVHSRLAARA